LNILKTYTFVAASILIKIENFEYLKFASKSLLPRLDYVYSYIKTFLIILRWTKLLIVDKVSWIN